MAALRTAFLIALATVVAAPSAAQASTLQPLRDVAPLGSKFKDRVTTSSTRVAHAALSLNWSDYKTKEGGAVAAAVSDRYGPTFDRTIVQSYVDFLDGLDHGSELTSLKIYIAPPAEVTAQCGGADGTLACYDSGTKIMVVPGEQTETGTSGVTTSYVVAHEYGHHIAAARSNAPFNAFRFGPKYWASYELVCNRASKGLLAPGNEDTFYLSNPGEGWAETYAQLKYPDVAWQYNPLMKPDQGAFDAARKDVLTPWTKPTSEVFTSSFGKRGTNVHRFKFDLTLDGALSMKLRGPSKSNYNLVISSNGRFEGRTITHGSRDSVSYQAACREDQLEHVSVAVKRMSGSGPFTLSVKYDG